MDVRSICLLALCILSASAQEDWELHCNRCHCLWVSGKKTANCAGRGFDSIPDDLSVDIREIDFSNNFFYSLEREVFSKAHMADVQKLKLQKLKLQNCSIGRVNAFAFSKLRFIIELNLAMNNIDTLDKNVFKDTIKLRTLLLSNNKIRVLEDGLFSNLTFLQKILLDYNEIEHISEETFKILPALKHISLAHNKIQRITFDIKVGLPKLSSLSVEGNPWICDCLLREFRNSAQKNNLITTSITCQNPPILKGRSWLDNIVFACEPKVVEAGPFATMEALNSNISLTCKVVGDPIPDVDWMTSGAIIERDPRRNKQKYITSKDTIDGVTWNNLTIINVGYKDRGKRNSYINPVMKPVRTTVPPSVVSWGNEVSDVMSNLLDCHFVFDCDDETRSLDFDQPLLRKSNMMLDTSDFPLNSHYPPDLLQEWLKYPQQAARHLQCADTTRLPPHHGPQSPMHSPLYDQLSLYRTLPYSRSHSSFVGPATRIPRQGYATIPRRPRLQSRSSEPLSMSEYTAEPLYDNLGIRTTADGGTSTLSVNIIINNAATTPILNKISP